MKKIKFIAVFVFCVMVHSAYSQEVLKSAYPDATQISEIEKLFPMLDSMVEAYAKANRFPSISYGVVVGNHLIHSKYWGTINLEQHIAASSQSDYHIASMTKSITALAILKLRDEKKLSLDDPVSKYIPQAKNLKLLTTDAPAITIRHLLTHNAGFPEDNPWGDRQLGRTDEYLENLYKQGISFSTATGTAYEYSNLGFATLGLIIKKVSGKTYQEYITENILKPLGMTHTYWDYNDVPGSQLAMGYRSVEGKWIPQPLLHSGSFGAMGGLITTIEDFSKYMSFQLSAWPPRDEKETGPVRRSSLREMQHGWNFAKLWKNEKNYKGEDCVIMDFYCYGLHQYLDCNGLKIITHSGGLPGFGSQWRILPDYNIGIVVFANRTYAPMGTLLTDAINTVLNKTGLQPRPAAYSAILEKRKKQLVALLPAWNNADKAGIFADNFFDDYFIDVLRKETAEAYKKAGKINSVSDVVATNNLRGYFLMHGEHADIKIYFTLSPETDPKIQAYQMDVLQK